MEASMDHIQTFIHPQVIIIDNPSKEDTFFVNTLRTKAMYIGKSIIELPSDATENMMWITRLDSGSLAGMFHHPLSRIQLLTTSSMVNNLHRSAHPGTIRLVGVPYSSPEIHRERRLSWHPTPTFDNRTSRRD